MERLATVEYGDVLTLICTASGGPNNMFRWSKDGDFLDEGTDGVLNITDVTADDGGLYECIVNNTAGSSFSNITIYGRTCISSSTQYSCLVISNTVYYCTMEYSHPA